MKHFFIKIPNFWIIEGKQKKSTLPFFRLETFSSLQNIFSSEKNSSLSHSYYCSNIFMYVPFLFVAILECNIL